MTMKMETIALNLRTRAYIQLKALCMCIYINSTATQFDFCRRYIFLSFCFYISAHLHCVIFIFWMENFLCRRRRAQLPRIWFVVAHKLNASQLDDIKLNLILNDMKIRFAYINSLLLFSIFGFQKFLRFFSPWSHFWKQNPQKFPEKCVRTIDIRYKHDSFVMR